MYGAPTSGPSVASSSAALSRTERVRAWSTTSQWYGSAKSGPVGLRPRVGLKPKRPQLDAGMRMEPPPSDACAKGTMPLATAAAAPPLEPPGERSRFHGLRHGPSSSLSVVGSRPSSGVFVLPSTTSPARRWRFTSSLSWSGTKSFEKREPPVSG